MAQYPFRLPDIGEGIAEAEIVAWHVAVGDAVEEDQPVADLMTDKATVEMTSPVAGTVVELAGAVGDTIAIGSVLLLLETGAEPDADISSAEAPARSGGAERAQADAIPAVATETSDAPASIASTPKAAPASVPEKAEGRILASPAVRARAKALGIDLADVRVAQGDRIRHADLDAYLRYGAGTTKPTPTPMAAARNDSVEEIRLAGLRKRIAARMSESKRHIPHFSYVEECDVTALEALRAVMNAGRGDRAKLTLLPFLIRAMVLSIRDYPAVNAHFDDEREVIRRFGAVHMGLATQTPQGLMVPVLRDADQQEVWALSARIAELAAGARAGSLSSGDLSGSTITLTSLGALGGIVSTPILNRPEVGIVGVNRIVERPVVVEGRIEIRKCMNLSSSFDHRIVDGHEAASFIQAIRRRIEQPALLFA